MLDLEFIGEDVREHLDKNGIKRNIWKRENLSEFASRSGYAISLIFREKEIILFTLLQWAAIALAYYVWVQILGWIPDEVWESDSKIYDIPLNLAFLAWSFLCVALAAYPIGVLTGAMGAAHFLREQGHPSTIAACLKLALPNSTKLWMFHLLDGWLTVDIILERLPKKRHFSPAAAARRAVAEALYYAWKVGTIGVAPALLTGKGLIEAGKESIALVKSKTWEVLKLRGGYSAVCWIVAIAAYIGSMAFFISFPSPFGVEHKMLSFYAWMGVPILVAVGVIKLFVRPIYVIASCQMYSDFLKENGRSVEFGNLPGRGMSTLAAFLMLCAMVSVVFLYREETGLMALLSGGSTAEGPPPGTVTVVPGVSRAKFGMGSFAPSVVDGKPLNPVFRYPEGTQKVFAIFDYAGMTPQTHWGWRLSREGALLDETQGLRWKAAAAGTFVLPLKVPGDAGIYDLDLFLNDTRQGIPSFIVGEPVPPKDRLRQADDFEGQKSYWGSAERTEGGAARFKTESGHAAITLLQGDGLSWKTSGQSFDDVVVEVDATPLGEPDSNAYGVVLRYQDDRNFYAFLINSEGEFAILRVKDGKQLWEKEWTQETTDIIHRGKNTNRVRVLLEGELLRLYVNGRVVGGLAEALWRDGKAGILVLGRGKPGAGVGFDNWRVWSPPGKYELAPDKAPWARFDFVKPGVTRAEVDKRLGKPYISSISVVAQGRIDLFLDEAPTEQSNPQRAPQPTEDVHYYDYRPDRSPSEHARIVFRKDKIWYAMLPTHSGERTREEVIAYYGNVFEEQKVHRRSGHVLSVDVILWLRRKGLAFVEKPGQGITHRVVFPAEP